MEKKYDPWDTDIWDYKDPNFENCGKVHEWKNYILEDLQKIWPTFTDTQKRIIAKNARELASREEWD